MKRTLNKAITHCGREHHIKTIYTDDINNYLKINGMYKKIESKIALSGRTIYKCSLFDVELIK